MWIWRSFLVNAMFMWCAEGTLCSLKNRKIICSKALEDDLYSNITLAIDSVDVLDLTIADTTVSSINSYMFRKYKNMHTLSLKNINLKNINDSTFEDLNKLRNLYLSGNLLERFSFDIFSKNNALYSLDVSDNNLKILDDFNSSLFNSLTLLNISNNNFEYLPAEILTALLENSRLYLIIDNNPWNCSRSEWSQVLNSNLTVAFCADIETLKMVEDNEVQVTPLIQNLDVIKERVLNVTETQTKSESKLCAYETKCFSYCVFWFLGGIWVGIILGNLCKLKTLICPSTTNTSQEKDTQYNKFDVQLKD